MLNHTPSSYRWQDHVITPPQTARSLIATGLIVAALGTAGLFARQEPVTAAHAAATERTPSLAEIAKRPGPRPAAREWLGGC